MVVLGLEIADTPPFGGKRFNIFTAANTTNAVTSFGVLENGKPCQVAWLCFFTTLI